MVASPVAAGMAFGWIGCAGLTADPEKAGAVARRRISCSSLVFLVRAARDDPDRIVGQWPV